MVTVASKSQAIRRASTDSRSSRSSAAVNPVSLSEQLRKVLRHPLVLLLSVLTGMGLAGLASLTQDQTYKATSTVVAYPLTTDPNAQASNQITVDINTEASVANSRQVANAAAEKLNPSDTNLPQKLDDTVDVAAHSGTAILDFTATADSADEAAQYANAVADAYLQVRRDALKDTVNSNVQNINDALNSLDDSKKITRSQLEEKLAQVQITSTSAGRVVSYAEKPDAPTNLGLPKYLLVGAIAGLLVGALLAWLVDSRERRVKYFDRAGEAVSQDVHEIRGNHQVEDARRLLFSLGAARGDFLSSGRRGAVIYSPTPLAAGEFSTLLSEATGTADINYASGNEATPWNTIHAGAEAGRATILTAGEDTEISQVLRDAYELGTCLVVITPETTMRDLKEFDAVAHTAEADVKYVYLQK